VQVDTQETALTQVAGFVSQRSVFLADEPANPASVNINEGQRLVLFDAWFECPAQQRGSYVYNKKWETIDHVMLSPGLFDEAGFKYTKGQFKVMKADFMLDPKTGFPKRSDPRTPSYSDHLPLLVTLAFVELNQ
jgi:hypothetical protein